MFDWNGISIAERKAIFRVIKIIKIISLSWGG